MAGVAGLEPVTSAVTGQRSNQLSYTPTIGEAKCMETRRPRQGEENPKKIRAADAKEVGVGNPAEETYCCPDIITVSRAVLLSTAYPRPAGIWRAPASFCAERRFRKVGGFVVLI